MDIYVVIGYSICDNPYCSAIEEPFGVFSSYEKAESVAIQKNTVLMSTKIFKYRLDSTEKPEKIKYFPRKRRVNNES